MVLGILDSILESVSSPFRKLFADPVSQYYQREGFNRTEAVNLSWLSNAKCSGDGNGVAVGIGLVVLFNKRIVDLTYKLPYLFYGRTGLWLLRILIPCFAGITAQYFATFYRKGSNGAYGNLYSNNSYVYAKDSLIRNFVILNRRFTEDERKQFLFNIQLQKKGQKKYVFNPLLHGSEEEYRKEYERMNGGKAVLSQKSKDEIEQDNREKVVKHEGIVLQKPNHEKFLRFDDRHLGLKRLQIIKKEYII